MLGLSLRATLSPFVTKKKREREALEHENDLVFDLWGNVMSIDP